MAKFLKKAGNMTATSFLIFIFAFYQILMPTFFSRAQEAEIIENQDQEKQENTQETENQKLDSSEPTEVMQNDEELNPEVKNIVESAQNINNTEEIKNENETSVENKSAAVTNTGENAISNESQDTNLPEDTKQENSIGPEAEIPTEEIAGNSEEPKKPENSDKEEEESDKKDQKNQELSEKENMEPILNEDIIQEDSSVIKTGDAQSQVDVVNDINSNKVGTNWIDLIINITGTSNQDINLLINFLSLIEKSLLPEQPSDNQSTKESEISNSNQAEIKNEILAVSNSGENQVSGSSNQVEIDTGDATAIANLVNIINRNLVGNGWLFAVINVLGDFNGDIIVPGQDLIEIGNDGDGCNSECKTDIGEITSENKAIIENQVDAQSNTGNNEILNNGGEALIKTGESLSESNVTNIINSNIVGSGWFKLFLNIMGGIWNGKTDNCEGEGDGQNFDYDFQKKGGDDNNDPEENSTTLNKIISSIKNFNLAKITNSVIASANTGDNKALDNENNVLIETGNASAKANVLNLVNTNIIGNNWFFSIINVMGKWTGNLIFAYPDLEIKINDGKNKVKPGEELDYNISIKNNGKADGKNIKVLAEIPNSVINLISSEGKINDGMLVFEIPVLKAGVEKNFVISGLVSENYEETYEIKSLAKISTETSEKELSNNFSYDTNQVFLNETIFKSKDNSGSKKENSSLKTERSFSSSTTAIGPGTIIKHRIIIKNNGENEIFNIIVRDKSRNESGQEILSFFWNIGSLKEGEKVIIEYEIQLNQGVPGGQYQYESEAEGIDGYKDFVKSNKAKNSIRIESYYGKRSAHDSDNNSFINSESSLIPEAEAAVAGESIVKNPNITILPWGFWVLAILAYFLTINWSLFPIKKKDNE